MAKTESTAVNNLIALTQNNERTSKPIVHPDDDLFAKPPTKKQLKNTPGAMPVIPKPTAAPSRMTGNLPALQTAGPVPPLPRMRAPIGTSQLTLPEHQARRSMTVPALPPPNTHRTSAPVFTPNARISQPVFTTRMPDGRAPDCRPPDGSPQAMPMPRPTAVDMTGDVVRAENWFESSRAVEKFEDVTYVGTSPHVKYERGKDSVSLVKKLILPAIGFIVIGAAIGGFIAFRGDKKPATPVAAAVSTPVAARATTANLQRAAAIANGANTGVPSPITETPPSVAGVAAVPVALPSTEVHEVHEVHEVQTTRGVVKLADVRIDSKPAGATVTLVEHTASGDKRSFIGSTPIATSVDTSHQFEVELELAGHAPQTTHLDPAKTTRVSFDFKRVAKTVAAAPVVVAPVVHHHAAIAKTVHSAPTATLADPGFDAAPAQTAPAAPSGGMGTLMLSSKPPCDILVDGKPTGLATPQRAMELPAGTHKITLVNEAAGINKTVMIQINAGQPTKLVKDLLAN